MVNTRASDGANKIKVKKKKSPRMVNDQWSSSGDPNFHLYGLLLVIFCSIIYLPILPFLLVDLVALVGLYINIIFNIVIAYNSNSIGLALGG